MFCVFVFSVVILFDLCIVYVTCVYVSYTVIVILPTGKPHMQLEMNLNSEISIVLPALQRQLMLRQNYTYTFQSCVGVDIDYACSSILGIHTVYMSIITNLAFVSGFWVYCERFDLMLISRVKIGSSGTETI
jgi:hypothetical protein